MAEKENGKHGQQIEGLKNRLTKVMNDFSELKSHSNSFFTEWHPITEAIHLRMTTLSKAADEIDLMRREMNIGGPNATVSFLHKRWAAIEAAQKDFGKKLEEHQGIILGALTSPNLPLTTLDSTTEHVWNVSDLEKAVTAAHSLQKITQQVEGFCDRLPLLVLTLPTSGQVLGELNDEFSKKLKDVQETQMQLTDELTKVGASIRKGEPIPFTLLADEFPHTLGALSIPQANERPYRVSLLQHD
ncbi:MAG: hypothetical protein V4568_17395 [Pseudomonadota bacterium]